MFAKQINLEEKETTVEELLALIQEGNELILMKGDTPIARISPIEPLDNPRIPDLFPGIWTSDDFDDPLPDEFWLGEDS